MPRTNARTFQTASTITQAQARLSDGFDSRSLVVLSEGADHWDTLRKLLSAGKVVGGQVHDARIAAICLDHGVREFWTADRDFNRFPRLTVRNPLVG